MPFSLAQAVKTDLVSEFKGSIDTMILVTGILGAKARSMLSFDLAAKIIGTSAWLTTYSVDTGSDTDNEKIEIGVRTDNVRSQCIIETDANFVVCLACSINNLPLFVAKREVVSTRLYGELEDVPGRFPLQRPTVWNSPDFRPFVWNTYSRADPTFLLLLSTSFHVCHTNSLERVPSGRTGRWPRNGFGPLRARPASNSSGRVFSEINPLGKCLGAQIASREEIRLATT